MAYLGYRLPVVVHVSPATMHVPLLPHFDRNEVRLK